MVARPVGRYTNPSVMPPTEIYKRTDVRTTQIRKFTYLYLFFEIVVGAAITAKE